jgi:tripeptide aminopeptidase
MLRHPAIDLALELLAIPGGSGHESAVMKFIRDRLAAAGCPRSAMRHDQAHRRSPRGGDVGNLIVKLPGSRGQARRLLCAHTDTVPICVGTQPRRRGDIVRSAVPGKGLGADDRSGVAIVLHTACELLRRRGQHPPLTLAFTVQEEAGVIGARVIDVAALGKPVMAFNFDGGSDKLIIGAIGSHQAQVDVQGLAAHAGLHPQLGVNALTIASLAIASLHENGWLGLVARGRRSGRVNVGTIQGGAANNVVAPGARVTFGVRSHETAFRARMLREIHAAFQRAARQVRSSAGKRGSVAFQSELNYESFTLSRDEPAVAIALDAARRVTGQTLDLGVSNGGLDANWLNSHGIPTVTLATGQHNNHTEQEYLDLRQFVTQCDVAMQLALG